MIMASSYEEEAGKNSWMGMRRSLLEEEEYGEGFSCQVPEFEELERAANRLDTPVFFRMSFFDFIKMNLLSYSKLKYECFRWYKVDVLLDWE